MVVRNTQIFGTRVIDMLVEDPGGRTCVGHGRKRRLVTEQTPSMRLNVPGRFDPPRAVECSYVSDNHRIVRT
jgi:hypothetical protein